MRAEQVIEFASSGETLHNLLVQEVEALGGKVLAYPSTYQPMVRAMAAAFAGRGVGREKVLPEHEMVVAVRNWDTYSWVNNTLPPISSERENAERFHVPMRIRDRGLPFYWETVWVNV